MLVLRVFQVTIRRIGRDILAVAPLVVEYLPDFLGRLKTVIVVHYVCYGNEDIGNAVRVTIAVHVFRKTDKADAHLYKEIVNQAPGVTIIPGKPGKVFYNDAVDFTLHHVGQEPLKIFPVGVCSRMAVIHIFLRAAELVSMALTELGEQIALVFHAVAIVLALLGLFQILLGEPDIHSHIPAAGGIGWGDRLLLPPVFGSCHLYLLPYHITPILYLCSGGASRMPPPWDTLSQGPEQTAAQGFYSPLFCRTSRSVSLSWSDGPSSENSTLTPTPPTQKQ